jgi:hypothetical protein
LGASQKSKSKNKDKSGSAKVEVYQVGESLFLAMVLVVYLFASLWF